MVRAIKVVPLAEDGYNAAPGAPAPRSFGAGSARRGSAGSGAMGKVPSLLFDLEDLGEGSQHPPAHDAADEASADDVMAKLSALLEPWSEPGKPGCLCLAGAQLACQLLPMFSRMERVEQQRQLHCSRPAEPLAALLLNPRSPLPRCPVQSTCCCCTCALRARTPPSAVPA